MTALPMVWLHLHQNMCVHIKRQPKIFAELHLSVLRRTKTFLGTTMHQYCLPSLGLVHIHREKNVDVEKAINTFASVKTENCHFYIKPFKLYKL